MNPKATKKIATIADQFTFQKLPQHFERDTHIHVQNLTIYKVHVLAGATPEKDIIVVEYKDSPNLSFYDAEGKLVDIDHYLPDAYKAADLTGADTVINNLRGLNVQKAKSTGDFKELLEATLIAGQNDLASGLNKKFGLATSNGVQQAFFEQFNVNKGGKLLTQIGGQFRHFYHFLESYILFQQRHQSSYIHITPNDNIIITPLNKRSGVAVIMETQDGENQLLPPNKWAITRTQDVATFEQALVFRSDDVKAFFDTEGGTEVRTTDRYKLYHSHGEIAIDSLLDNTDNLLKVELVNNCFQVLHSDSNIIVALSNEQEMTIINTHRSIVPHKWPKKVFLPEVMQWMRVDENLCTAFVQNLRGQIIVLDITTDQPQEVARFGQYAPGYDLDQSGDLLVKELADNLLVKIETNAIDLEIPYEQRNLATVLGNLSHLFKGQSLFTKKQFAKIVTEQKVKKAKKSLLPKAFQGAKYDFETNVEHKLVEAGNDYEALLKIQNQIAIARQNIAEEMSAAAEKEGVFLVGQRLQSTINTIIGPAEKRVRNLVEESRAAVILAETQAFQLQIQRMTDPDGYRTILNTVRQFNEELLGMLSENRDTVYTEFKAIQEELDHTFSEQIAKDGTALQTFITGEIQQIETAIANTHDPRQLEILISTHPAALELMSLLKQPFILQNIAKERSLSPAGIQKRLYEAVANRKAELRAEIEKKELEKNAAKQQLATMIRESIDFFVKNHSGGFADLELSNNATHRQILRDILKVERTFQDIRLAIDLRRRLERKILERNRADLEKMVAYEGKYAYIQNDPDLYVDMDSNIRNFPKWNMDILEKKGALDTYLITFVRDTDLQVYRPSTTDNLQAGRAFEIKEMEYDAFAADYEKYSSEDYAYEFVNAVWLITIGRNEVKNFPQFEKDSLKAMLPKTTVGQKALWCALEKKYREHLERTRVRNVPKISPEFIDETPYFQHKMQEFVIKSKLQLVHGAGLILLSGPPSTGKSAFLKFIAATMNREYFEHAADKWQTKNSLVTAIKFGEFGPYQTPAGFTKAITTPYSLINIEEVKEWPEALRKSLNPFFAGSDIFEAPDGTRYPIGDNILMCAAANLGSMYRQDDEPFTADFWSRVEVVEYNYAPEKVGRTYLDNIHKPERDRLLTMQDLIRQYFAYTEAPDDVRKRAAYFTQQFLEFSLLPKTDEKVKRDNLRSYIRNYFQSPDVLEAVEEFSPEEAAKVALRRLKAFQGYTVKEFFDCYDHFVNGQHLRTRRLANLQTSDVDRYEYLHFLTLSLRYLEGCLRQLRIQFYRTAGQTEIEGTNREFIKCVHLLELLG
ncbi:MAG: hypothetical protein AAGJ18_08335 [Bacteroidota bacterium]